MIKTTTYTAFALVAFAFNSILCRLALRGGEADPVGFTAVRLASGAAALALISYLVSKRTRHVSQPAETAASIGSWRSAIYLFVYAICFSAAYVSLSAATGALILFGSVQMTMILIAVVRGERPRIIESLGMVTAFGGLVYLVLPGLESPPLSGSLLMAAAGGSWGLYTLRGKGAVDPLALTKDNFVRTLPFALLAGIVFIPNLQLTFRGIIFAVLSGALASGVGYTVWYAALKYHTMTRSAVLQLTVPVIAASLGIVLLGETMTPRLLIAASLILGGISATIIVAKRAAIR